MKNKENSDLSAKIEKYQVENEELKAELESLGKYKSKWEQSISLLQEADSQREYIRQQEDEIKELKAKIEKGKKEIEEIEEQKEEEIQNLKEEIEALQYK